MNVPIVRTLAVALVTAALAASLLAAMTSSARAVPAGTTGVVGGWFGWWASSAHVADVIADSDGTADDVMMFMWAFAGASDPACLINPDGGRCISGSTAARYDQARRSVQATGADFYASHTDLDAARRRQLSGYLSTRAKRQAFAELLAAKAVAARVDGIDLDWENFAFNDGSSTWTLTKPRFVDMIARLGAALHARGKKLSVTVPGGYRPWSGGQPVVGGGYTVYAWGEIAPHIDRLRLMAYDYSYSAPGPIGPNTWAKQVVTSAIAQVGSANAGKIWIGTPQYGRRWAVPQSTGRWGAGDCPATWTPSYRMSSLSLADVRARQSRYGAGGTWNAASAEWSFRYTATTDGTYVSGGVRKYRACKARHEVWYADEATARARLAIVAKYKIGGIAVWHLGGLEANFFSAGVASLARSIAAGTPWTPPVQVVLKAPSPAVVGTTITVTVRLRRGGIPLAGVPVQWGLRPVGVATVRWRAQVKSTSARGIATFTVTVGKAGRLVVRSADETVATFRATADLTVTPELRVAVDRTSAEAGSRLRYSGVLRPARAGVAITRYRSTTEGWTRSGRTVTDARGRFVLSVKNTPDPLVTRSRFVAAGGGGYTAATSPELVVTVQP